MVIKKQPTYDKYVYNKTYLRKEQKLSNISARSNVPKIATPANTGYEQIPSKNIAYDVHYVFHSLKIFSIITRMIGRESPTTLPVSTYAGFKKRHHSPPPFF